MEALSGMLEQDVQRNRLLRVEHGCPECELAVRSGGLKTRADFFHGLG
jgi:hypothetical protein